MRNYCRISIKFYPHSIYLRYIAGIFKVIAFRRIVRFSKQNALDEGVQLVELGEFHVHLLCFGLNQFNQTIVVEKKQTTNKNTSLNLFSNLKAPPPVAQTVVTSSAMPLALASEMKLNISDVGKRIKCSDPRRPRIVTSSIWKVI